MSALLRCSLLVISSLLAILALLLVVHASCSLLDVKILDPLLELLNLQSWTGAPHFIIGVGVVLTVLSILSLCGVKKSKRNILIIYCVLVAVLVTIQTSIVLLANLIDSINDINDIFLRHLDINLKSRQTIFIFCINNGTLSFLLLLHLIFLALMNNTREDPTPTAPPYEPRTVL